MAKKNFLLGKGERLTEQVRVPSGPVNKVPPYTFYEAKERLQPMLDTVVENLERLPSNAFPDDLAVATLTLHPEYIAKTYHPAELLRSLGLTAVGSRARKIKPERKSKDRVPEETTTTELFVIGKRNAFRNWANEMSNWSELSSGAKEIVEIEEINFPSADNKIKNIQPNHNRIVYEVVLHLDEESSEHRYLELFKVYLENIGINAIFERRFYSGRLCFLELEASSDAAKDIATFSLVRVIREMPKLRLLRPSVRSAAYDKGASLILPSLGAVGPQIKTAIFDGGIPDGHPICKWATPIDIIGVGPAEPELLEHGVSVTSAFLFGHIDPKKAISQPYSFVDHYRVLDSEPGQNPYELYEVLARIDDVLSTKKYDFINLSLGPSVPIDDDEIHSWTAILDNYLCDGLTLATIAVGNDGEGDPLINANRVQVPADCVNALSIGACDVPDTNWQRAGYSSIGPGRSPGIIKPDLVDFGGSIHRPFLTLDSVDGTKLLPTGGTSFSAPSVLRLASGVRAHFGTSLNALAIRTLLVHSAEDADIPKFEIGWGRVARDLEDIVTCENHVMRVVFQGKITASKFMRAPVPLPIGALAGMIKIKATLCYATSVDPHHPGNYTRSGLEVTFRPNKNIRRKVNVGETSPLHAKSKSFFGKTKKAFQTEEELRSDAWKWENCLHAENRYMGKGLNEPVFDIHYNARSEGHNDSRNQELHYALIITVEAPKINDFYDQVVRRYATQLEQLQPIIDIPVRV